MAAQHSTHGVGFGLPVLLLVVIIVIVVIVTTRRNRGS